MSQKENGGRNGASRHCGFILPSNGTCLWGNSPGVCLQAAGLYGFCVSRWHGRDRWPLAETVSKASFCIYLTHLFFLDSLAVRGISAGTLPPIWGVPVLVAVAFGGGFLVWLVLRRVPVVNTYLI